jgi:hypothetical protein
MNVGSQAALLLAGASSFDRHPRRLARPAGRFRYSRQSGTIVALVPAV